MPTHSVIETQFKRSHLQIDGAIVTKIAFHNGTLIAITIKTLPERHLAEPQRTKSRRTPKRPITNFSLIMLSSIPQDKYPTNTG